MIQKRKVNTVDVVLAEAGGVLLGQAGRHPGELRPLLLLEWVLRVLLVLVLRRWTGQMSLQLLFLLLPLLLLQQTHFSYCFKYCHEGALWQIILVRLLPPGGGALKQNTSVN